MGEEKIQETKINICTVTIYKINKQQGPIVQHTQYFGGFPGGSADKESSCNVGDLGLIPGWEDPLEKGKAIHSSILAWKIPWTVQSMGLQRAGHDILKTL